MGIYKDELHVNYQKSIQAFVHAYPHISDSLKKLIDNYCRTCAMYLWNSFSVDLKTCTECINEIYTDDTVKRQFTENQVGVALSKLAERHYSLPVPAFFREVIEEDKKDNTNYSRKLASCFGLVFISFALIDGTVEYEEIGDKQKALAYVLQMFYIDLSGVSELDSISYCKEGAFTKKQLLEWYEGSNPITPWVVSKLAEHAEFYSDSIVDKLYTWQLPVQICSKTLFLKIVHSAIDGKLDNEKAFGELKSSYKRFLARL